MNISRIMMLKENGTRTVDEMSSIMNISNDTVYRKLKSDKLSFECKSHVYLEPRQPINPFDVLYYLRIEPDNIEEYNYTRNGPVNKFYMTYDNGVELSEIKILHYIFYIRVINIKNGEIIWTAELLLQDLYRKIGTNEYKL